MGLLITTDDLKEGLHPEVVRTIVGVKSGTIELTDLRTEDLDCGIILVHRDRILNKGLSVLGSRKGCTCIWILQEIRLIAHRPVFNRVIGSGGTGTLNTSWV